MVDQIELHDSQVSVAVAGDTIVVHLCPAYVHHWYRTPSGWRGEGRSQAAEITVANGSVVRSSVGGVYRASGGWFEVGTQRYDNLIPVPFEGRAHVRGRLDLMGAEAIDMEGHGLAVSLVGEPEFVEELPLEWAPDRDAV